MCLPPRGTLPSSMTRRAERRPRDGRTPGRTAIGLALALTALAVPARAVEPPPAAAPSAGTTIVYGGDADFPPFEYLDALGQPAGLNVDLIRAIARDRGWQVRVELRAWPLVRRGLQQGEVDVAAMYRSPQRAREVDFAIAHELVYHELYVRRGSAPLRALDDLAGRRVLAQADTYAVDALQQLDLAGELHALPSEPDVLRALAAGQGDVAVVTQAVGRPFADREPLGAAVAATGPPVLLAEYAFVTRKDRRPLLEALTEGVAALKASGEYDRLYQRLVRPDRSAARLRQATWAAGLAAAALLLVAAWTWALRRRVAAQTAALRREFEAREQAQAALAQSERARRQSQKMEAIGRLAGGVAHDFNNLLGVILSYATFVRERLVALHADPADADEILAASERAGRLTRQLLAFSRATPVETRAVDLGEVVAGLSTMVQRLVGEHIRVETPPPPAPVVVEADPTLLEQMLLNLAANARDAMPEGGSLRLAVTARTLSGPEAHPLPAGEYAVLAVSDSGTGMDDDTRVRIFEPFFTTKAVGKGTGLGLATVSAHVQRLGGRVEVKSAPGEGATFTVLLPRSPLRDLAAARAERPPPPAASPQTILLVEDDEPLRRAARTALDRAGHRVLEAADGVQGAEVARGAGGLTMLVTDVVMPRRGGPQLAAELRQRHPGLRVLYLSGYVTEDAPLGMDAPGTSFLMKPCTPQALVEAVARLADGALSAHGPFFAVPSRFR